MGEVNHENLEHPSQNDLQFLDLNPDAMYEEATRVAEKISNKPCCFAALVSLQRKPAT